MDLERLTAKYTGHTVTLDDLMAAHRRGGPAAALADAVHRAADALAHTETELARIAGWITASTGKVTRAVDAGPDDTIPTINPLGELQAHGPRFDALVAVRDDRIGVLRTLVRLWQRSTPPTPTGPPPPATPPKPTAARPADPGTADAT